MSMSRGNRAGLTVLVVMLIAAVVVGIAVSVRETAPRSVSSVSDTLTVRQMVEAAPDTSSVPERKSRKRRTAKKRRGESSPTTVTRSPLDEVIEQK